MTPLDPPLPRGRARLLGDGIVYAAPGLLNTTQRHAATIVIALHGQQMAMRTHGGTVRGNLLVVRPLVHKQLLASHTPLVLIDLEPNHPQYRAFHAVANPGVCALDPGRQPELRQLAHAFYDGGLQGTELDAQSRLAIAQVAAEFPARPPLDLRVRQMMSLMDENPGASLDAVAGLVGLSAHRASQLFSRSLGLPLRRYSLSNKIRRAARFMGSGRKLTEVALAAGFVDSAHFAKVWTQMYGAPPSTYFPVKRTDMDAQALPDWVGWHMARRPPGLAPIPHIPADVLDT